MEWASPNLLKVWVEQKDGKRVNSFFARVGTSIFSHPQKSVLLDLSHLDSHLLFSFFSLQMADYGTSYLCHGINQFLYILCISYRFLFSGDPWQINHFTVNLGFSDYVIDLSFVDKHDNSTPSMEFFSLLFCIDYTNRIITNCSLHVCFLFRRVVLYLRTKFNLNPTKEIMFNITLTFKTWKKFNFTSDEDFTLGFFCMTTRGA